MGWVCELTARRNCLPPDVSGRLPSAFPKLFQSRFNGGFERRQIVLNRQPHANDVDSVVFVPQEIS
jgi:hypothetical protein